MLVVLASCLECTHFNYCVFVDYFLSIVKNMLHRTGLFRSRRAGDCTVHNLHHTCILAVLKFWLRVSIIFHTAFFVSQEVALGTPPGFQKLKHVLEIPFCCAEENSDYVFLMTQRCWWYIWEMFLPRSILKQAFFWNSSSFLAAVLVRINQCTLQKRKLDVKVERVRCMYFLCQNLWQPGS